MWRDQRWWGQLVGLFANPCVVADGTNRSEFPGLWRDVIFALFRFSESGPFQAMTRSRVVEVFISASSLNLPTFDQLERTS